MAILKHVMLTLIRVVLSVVAGFFLMWPLGYLYGVLGWPTFHLWGLMHGGFFSAWPTLSIVTFLALGYVPLFPRLEDTPLLIVGLVWGLLLTGFLGVGVYLSGSATYGLLAVTAAIVGALSFFAKHKLGLMLLAVSPIVFFHMQFLLGLMSSPTPGLLFTYSVQFFDGIKQPLMFAFIGWGLGSLARAILKRPAAAA
jgi:hypothetical protein